MLPGCRDHSAALRERSGSRAPGSDSASAHLVLGSSGPVTLPSVPQASHRQSGRLTEAIGRCMGYMRSHVERFTQMLASSCDQGVGRMD